MRETGKRIPAFLLVAALLGVVAAGCSDDAGADKAGGSTAPEVLRLAAAEDADQPDARLVRSFASRVSELSGGSLRVQVSWDAAGQRVAGHEQRIARMVRDGEFDLGWIGTRAWDGLGITRFQALQAPFLVTDHALLGRIATGAIGSRMLEGLDGRGFVGLALVPDRLRYAFGAQHALASRDDFAGARVRVQPSRATEALIRALGATPVHVSGEDVAAAVAHGDIDGAEASLGTNAPDEGENFVTVNLVLFAEALTLFAGADAYERLDGEQRALIRKAAQQTARRAATHPPSEAALLRAFCRERPVTAVAASRDDLASLRRAARPVYEQLEADVQTGELIREIRALAAAIPSSAAPAPPPGCVLEAPTIGGRRLDPSTLNGTYHWRVTRAGARAVGEPDSEDIGIVGKMTLRDGKWRMGESEPDAYSGTYEVRGDHMLFDWGTSTLVFRFDRRADGGLQLDPVPPMDQGDQVVWAGGPWRRVGPPVLATP